MIVHIIDIDRRVIVQGALQQTLYLTKQAACFQAVHLDSLEPLTNLPVARLDRFDRLQRGKWAVTVRAAKEDGVL